MDSRKQIVADAIGSVRAEGLEPGAAVIALLDSWASGAIETEQLGVASQLIAAGQPATSLLGRSEAA